MVTIYAVMWICVHLSGWTVTSDDAKLGRLEHPLLDDCCMTRSAPFFPDTENNIFDTFLAWKDAAAPRKETVQCACVQEPADGSRRTASSC